ncbi:hypothetical protein BKH43_07170 [Helicobacter sp. 13S00401-1]|uniref:M16 family metallopeptidase n=1 Tax=Helicobacter sp. 13S00401-1 TaxID=1905758 RepID=UPI000BA67662|nr:pitrilysin family protein [Helicobacter sp. 13S00401-1]PAF49298.1 hypothetical protein BKH43_07170 [Helicobacter sp. 13S00401-1]
MKFIVAFFIFLGVVMAGDIKYLEVKGVKIPVITEMDKNVSFGVIGLHFSGGGRAYDGNLPISNASAFLLSRGTKKLGNIDFNKALDAKAVELDVGTGRTTLVYSLKFLKQYEDFSINMLGDLLKDPNLSKNALNDTISYMKANLASSKSDFDYQASQLLNETAFKGTPLAKDALGNLASIDKLNLKDIKNYLDSNVVLSRLVITAGGDLDSKTLEHLKKILEALPVGSTIEIPHYEFTITDAEKKALKDDTAIKTFKGVQQASIAFGAPLVGIDLKKDAYKARVASLILGAGGFGSRILETVRVKAGLAYSAYIGFDMGRVLSWAVGGMNTDLGANATKAIDLVKQTVQNFVDKGVSEQELDDAKKFLIGSEPLRNETIEQRLSKKYMAYFNGLPLNQNELDLEKVKTLTLPEINDFIKKHVELKNLVFALVTSPETKNAPSK